MLRRLRNGSAARALAASAPIGSSALPGIGEDIRVRLPSASSRAAFRG